MLKELIKDLNKLAKPQKAKDLAWFFKTGKGEYGEGDKFLGIMVPEQRKLVKKYYMDISLPEVQKILDSKFHEFRLTGVLILVEKYQSLNKGDLKEERLKKEICDLYLRNLKKGRINNWDLVDLSAPKILGDYFFDKKKNLLYNLVTSKNLWERRVAVLSTFYFIRKKDFKDALKIFELLLKDKEDLIHKAVGWGLREIGKREQTILINFLNKFTSVMPRTMLRYAIEKFKEENIQKYLLISKDKI